MEMREKNKDGIVQQRMRVENRNGMKNHGDEDKDGIGKRVEMWEED